MTRTRSNQAAALMPGQLAAKMAEHGALLRKPPIVDGRIHRCATVSHPRKKNFSYFVHTDGLFGWLENHETGEGVVRIDLREPGDRTPIVWDHETAKRLRREAEERHRARMLAREVCAAAKSAEPDNEYLVRKQIKPYDLLWDGKSLIAPMQSISGRIQTYQRIFDDGSKRFLGGGAVKYNFYKLGELSTARRILICEGVATAHTLYEALSLPVVSAMFADNLVPVAEVCRAAYPEVQYLVCADDDWKTEKNPGVTKARKVMQIDGIDCNIAIPDFSIGQRGDKDTDFNDARRLYGLLEVRRQVIWSL